MRAQLISSLQTRSVLVCLSLIGGSLALFGPSPSALATGQASDTRRDGSIDFTSIDLLTAKEFRRRDDHGGQVVSLHRDILVPVSLSSGCVTIQAKGLRLDRIYRIRHRPENIALVLTNVGTARKTSVFEATLTGRDQAQTYYGLMPELLSGASRRLLLSASTPLVGQRITIQLRA